MTVSGYRYENVLATDDPVVVGTVRRAYAMTYRHSPVYEVPVPTEEEAFAEQGMDYGKLAEKVEAIIKGGSGG